MGQCRRQYQPAAKGLDRVWKADSGCKRGDVGNTAICCFIDDNEPVRGVYDIVRCSTIGLCFGLERHAADVVDSTNVRQSPR